MPFSNPVIPGFTPDPSVCRVGDEYVLVTSSFTLRVEMLDAGFTAGPDRLRLGHDSPDGSFTVLAELDGRYLSTEVAGGFSGRVVGVYSVGGRAWFDWFELKEIVPA